MLVGCTKLFVLKAFPESKRAYITDCITSLSTPYTPTLQHSFATSTPNLNSKLMLQPKRTLWSYPSISPSSSKEIFETAWQMVFGKSERERRKNITQFEAVKLLTASLQGLLHTWLIRWVLLRACVHAFVLPCILTFAWQCAASKHTARLMAAKWIFTRVLLHSMAKQI